MICGPLTVIYASTNVCPMTADTLSSSCEHCLMRFSIWPLPLLPGEKKKEREGRRRRRSRKKKNRREVTACSLPRTPSGWLLRRRTLGHAPVQPGACRFPSIPAVDAPFDEASAGRPLLCCVCVFCVSACQTELDFPATPRTRMWFQLLPGLSWGGRRVSPPLDPPPAPPSLTHTSHLIYCLHKQREIESIRKSIVLVHRLTHCSCFHPTD